jgi:Methyltransferase domain
VDTVTVADAAVIEHGAQQKPAELARFLSLLADAAPRIVIEIGSDAGGTLYAWSHLPSAPGVIAVSRAGLAGARVLRDPRLFGAVLVDGDSADPATVQQVAEILEGALADVLFIDADHSYEATRHNYAAYAPLIRPGGLIAFHDIAGIDDVRRAWDEISAGTVCTELIEPPRDWGGIGVIWKGAWEMAEASKTAKPEHADKPAETAKPAGPVLARAAESTDPAVQFVLAKREIAISNEDADAIAACDDELAALGVA